MTTTERPPAGLEYKTAALADTATTGADPAVWEGIVGVVGAPTDRGITYSPGAVTRSVARRWPKVTTGPSWMRRGGVVDAIEELEPGDPRIPATLADGTPWPSGAGAVWARVRFIPTADGAQARNAAHTAGPAEWRFGFMRPRSTGPAHARVLHDLDLLALWPASILDENEVKSLTSPTGSRFEVKSAAPAVRRPVARDRPGVPRVEPCSVCRLPAAGLVGGGLRSGEALVCARCVATMTDALDERGGDPRSRRTRRGGGDGRRAGADPGAGLRPRDGRRAGLDDAARRHARRGGAGPAAARAGVVAGHATHSRPVVTAVDAAKAPQVRAATSSCASRSSTRTGSSTASTR